MGRFKLGIALAVTLLALGLAIFVFKLRQSPPVCPPPTPAALPVTVIPVQPYIHLPTPQPTKQPTDEQKRAIYSFRVRNVTSVFSRDYLVLVSTDKATVIPPPPNPTPVEIPGDFDSVSFFTATSCPSVLPDTVILGGQRSNGSSVSGVYYFVNPKSASVDVVTHKMVPWSLGCDENAKVLYVVAGADKLCRITPDKAVICDTGITIARLLEDVKRKGIVLMDRWELSLYCQGYPPTKCRPLPPPARGICMWGPYCTVDMEKTYLLLDGVFRAFKGSAIIWGNGIYALETNMSGNASIINLELVEEVR